MAKNWEHAAGVLWPILIEAAERNRTLTYSDVAPVIDTNPLSVRNALGPILFYCLENKLPPLTVVIIGKNSGIPGTGFIAWDVDDLVEAYRHVYNFNWDTIENPFVGYGPHDTTESFAKIILEDPGSSEDVYSKVKVRGTAQKVFRAALLEAYEYQCAICRLSFEEALEAAHIISWAKCEHYQRISPTNGILLCANHHRLFDCGSITLTETYEIEYEDEYFEPDNYSESDMQASVRLNGQRIFLPEKSNLRPSRKLLRIRGEE